MTNPECTAVQAGRQAGRETETLTLRRTWEHIVLYVRWRDSTQVTNTRLLIAGIVVPQLPGTVHVPDPEAKLLVVDAKPG